MIERGSERRLEMFRRLPIAVAVVALVTLMAAPGAYADRGGMDRPFQATLVGEAHWDSTGEVRPDCGPVTTLTNPIGRATHMGKVTASSSHCPALPQYIGDGLLTIVAANGDELYGAYDYNPSDETNVIPVTLSGGTGRFEGASGLLIMKYSIEQQFSAVCTVKVPELVDALCTGDPPYMDITVPWPWSAKLTGTINY
jgi:hypothetical protein